MVHLHIFAQNLVGGSGVHKALGYIMCSKDIHVLFWFVGQSVDMVSVISPYFLSDESDLLEQVY